MTKRMRLASEIVGFAMVSGIVAASGASLLYFVGNDIDSTAGASESAVRQKMDQISESLRIVRTYYIPNSNSAWGVEIVNTGLEEIKITRVHYIIGGQPVTVDGCTTMSKQTSAETDPCVIRAGQIVDVRFSLPRNPPSGSLESIIVSTHAQNTFRLFNNE